MKTDKPETCCNPDSCDQDSCNQCRSSIACDHCKPGDLPGAESKSRGDAPTVQSNRKTNKYDTGTKNTSSRAWLNLSFLEVKSVQNRIKSENSSQVDIEHANNRLPSVSTKRQRNTSKSNEPPVENRSIVEKEINQVENDSRNLTKSHASNNSNEHCPHGSSVYEQCEPHRETTLLPTVHAHSSNLDQQSDHEITTILLRQKKQLVDD